MSQSFNLENQFLLSMPQLASDYFSASLIFICDHNEHGALGLVINKPSDHLLSEVLEQLELSGSGVTRATESVFRGGPVAEDRGFMLHERDTRKWDSSINIGDDLSLTTSMDLLAELAQDRGPDRYLFTLGYSGWGPGQLEDEISRNLWLSAPANLDILFDLPADAKLPEAAKQMGIDLTLMSAEAGHA